MRVLVTGATGFIGSNLALALAEQHEVLATGKDGEQPLPGISVIHRGELTDIPWEDIGRIDALFHQAAVTDTSVRDRNEMMRVNVEASKAVFSEAREHGCRHIVFASSTAVYGNTPPPLREDGPIEPLNPYAESKALLETFAREFWNAHRDVRIVGLRYCNVYGPREGHKGNMASMVYRLAQQMKKSDPNIFKFGEQRRDYVYIEDVVRANVLALNAAGSCIVNCATGNSPTFNELVAVLNAQLGLSRDPVYIDNPSPSTYQSDIRCDTFRAKRMLGFEAQYDINRGVAAYDASGFLRA